MARSDTLRSELARLQTTEASLRRTVATAGKTAAAARATAAQKRSLAARTKSPTTRTAALRAAETQDKKAATAEKKVNDAQAKLSDNAKRQATKLRSLAAAERSEQRSATHRHVHAATVPPPVLDAPDDAAAPTPEPDPQPVPQRTIIRLPEAEPLRVLYMTSNPEPSSAGAWLRTDAEVRLVQQMIRRSRYRDLVDVELRPAAGPQDLLDAINDVRPHVIHFSGHGWSSGLVMDNGSSEQPQAVELEYKRLARILAATTTPPMLLVLNACDTLQEAELLLSAVPVVIAMSDTIADAAASVFASQFYAAIASAQSVGAALEQGRVAIDLAQLEEDAELPGALTRDDVDIDELILVTPGK